MSNTRVTGGSDGDNLGWMLALVILLVVGAMFMVFRSEDKKQLKPGPFEEMARVSYDGREWSGGDDGITSYERFWVKLDSGKEIAATWQVQINKPMPQALSEIKSADRTERLRIIGFLMPQKEKDVFILRINKAYHLKPL